MICPLILNIERFGFNNKYQILRIVVTSEEIPAAEIEEITSSYQITRAYLGIDYAEMLVKSVPLRYLLNDAFVKVPYHYVLMRT